VSAWRHSSFRVAIKRRAVVLGSFGARAPTAAADGQESNLEACICFVLNCRQGTVDEQAEELDRERTA